MYICMYEHSTATKRVFGTIKWLDLHLVIQYWSTLVHNMELRTKL